MYIFFDSPGAREKRAPLAVYISENTEESSSETSVTVMGSGSVFVTVKKVSREVWTGILPTSNIVSCASVRNCRTCTVTLLLAVHPSESVTVSVYVVVVSGLASGRGQSAQSNPME